MSIHKFNRFLAEVGQSRSYKELNENLLLLGGRTEKDREEKVARLQKTNTYLDAIYCGNPDYLKSLIEKGYGIHDYKDTAMKLAVKRGNMDIILTLYGNKHYNITYAGLRGLMECVSEFGNPELFDKLIKNFSSQIIKHKQETRLQTDSNSFFSLIQILRYGIDYSVRDWYLDQEYIDFTEITTGSLYHQNIVLFMHLVKKYSEFINFEEISKCNKRRTGITIQASKIYNSLIDIIPLIKKEKIKAKKDGRGDWVIMGGANNGKMWLNVDKDS